MTVTEWPTCATCAEPYSISMGLPVVARSIGSGGLVGLDIDTSELVTSVRDDSASISCACEQPDVDDNVLDALEAALEEAWKASKQGSEVVLDRRVVTS